MKEKGLNQKQRLFVEAYLADPNATKAAIKAGYSRKTAYSQGHDLLKKPEIQKALEKRVEKAVITADEVLHGIRDIALSGDRESDRLRAYELLGKHLALFTERQDVSLSGEVGTRLILPEGDDGDR